MLKTYCIFFILIISFFIIHADITEFDRNFKENPALGIENAVILLKKSIINHAHLDILFINTHYVKIKLFTKKAIEEYGTLKLTFNPQKEKINNIEGTVYLPNNKKVKLSKKDIHTKKLSKEWGNKEKEISIVFPSLVKGAIIEYSYNYSSEYLEYISKWYFQSNLYTVQSEVKFIPIQNRRTGIAIQNQIEKPYFNKTKRSAKKCFELERSNIPPLKKEEFSLAYDSLKEAVILYYFDTLVKYKNYWIDKGNDDFRIYYKKKMKSCKAAKKIVTENNLKDSNPDKMITKIYSYVLKNYIPILKASKKEIGKIDKKYLKKMLRANSVKKMLKLKYLYPNQINFVLASLIKTAAPETKINFVLYTPWNKSIFNKSIKTFNQFTEISMKVIYKKNTYWLSPGKRLLPANVMPWDLRGTKVLLIGDNGTSFERIPLEKATNNISKTIVDVTFKEDTVIVKSSKSFDNHKAYSKRAILTFFEEKEIRDLIEKEVKDNYGDETMLISYNIENLKDISKTLTITKNFSYPFEPDEAGNKIFLKLIGLNKYTKNQFNSGNRKQKIIFNYPKIATQTITYHLPKNLKLSSLPENTKINTSGLHYSMTFSKNTDNTVILNVEDRLDRSVYPKEAVSIFRSIYNTIIKANDTSMILEERK